MTGHCVPSRLVVFVGTLRDAGEAMPGVKKVVKPRLEIVFSQDRGRCQIVFKAQSAYTSFDVVRQARKTDWSVL